MTEVQLPAGWSHLALSDLVDNIRESARISSDEEYELWSIPSFADGRPESIQGKDIGSGKLSVKPGDVLISKINPRINRVWLVKETQTSASQIASPEWLVARMKTNTLMKPEFLQLYLSSPAFRDWISGAASSVTGSHSRAKANQILERLIPVPSLDEQTEIVRILEEQFSRLEAAAASIAAVRRKADQFRRSLLHAAFTGHLTQHGARRMNPAEDQTSSIPDRWMMKTIGDLASYVRGVTYEKSLSRTSPAKGYTPLLRATNIDSGALILEDFVYVPEDTVKAEQLLKIGDLVIAASSGSSSVVGKSAPIVTDFSGTFGAFCAVLRADLAISNKYLGYYIQSPSVRELWSSLARGTNINNLKRDQVCSTPIAVPPRNEQDEIVRILEEQFSRQEAILTVADVADRKVAALRRSLLHAAFSGELTKEWREKNNG